jgi:hypothetical protein
METIRNSTHNQPVIDEETLEVVQKIREARISTLFEVLNQYLKSIDKVATTIIVASAVAHCVPGEMLWIRLYGGSRSGKTELLRAIAGHPDSTELEVITPASIRGGLEGGHKLLERINGKLVITKDLASILTAKRETRNEVFGLLRNIKDGRLTADFGTEDGYVVQVARFDWIIGTTPVFAQYKQFEDLLGARYIDLNWRIGDREEMAYQAMANNPILETVIRPAIAKAVDKLIDRAKIMQQSHPAELRESTKRIIMDWADLTARLRSPVVRDAYHRVRFHPEPEVGTDLAQGFERIAKGLILIPDVRNIELYIARLCEDSIPYDRRELIGELLREGTVTANTGGALYFNLEDLRLLGVCEKVDAGYSLKPELVGRIGLLFGQWE